MAEAPQKETEKRPLPGSPEARESGRRNLNSQIAQRQKMLLAGIGAIAQNKTSLSELEVKNGRTPPFLQCFGTF